MSSINTEELTDSWVELGGRSNTPLAVAGEEYLRLLREAQREGSSRHSLASSGRTSPKSPPNTPNTERSTEDELRGLMEGGYHTSTNTSTKDCELNSAEWVWQWSSRPDQIPPKDWKFRHPSYLNKKNGGGLSLRRARIGGRPLFSADIFSTLLLSNIISLLLGAGLGIWLSRRTVVLPKISLQ